MKQPRDLDSEYIVTKPSPEVTTVLRDLSERCLTAVTALTKLAVHTPFSSEHDRLLAKAEGVLLVQSYIREAAQAEVDKIPGEGE